MSELLRTENVSEVFGGLKAVTDFNIHLDRGELVGLIGPNGAGKTTAFNMLTGVYQPTTGTITFEGESIVGLKPYQVTQRGIARTFQNIRLFSELTVLENVKIAFHYHVKYGILESVFRIGRYFKEKYGADFVFVTHYPSKKRPFYAMDDPEDPKYTLSFDLLFRGLEVTTGGQRIHDYDQQVQKMLDRGMHPEEFESYLMIHKHGMPPHGGLGIGLERLTAQLCGLDNVRYASLFPRDLHRMEP